MLLLAQAKQFVQMKARKTGSWVDIDFIHIDGDYEKRATST
jgi:hypothetical protein